MSISLTKEAAEYIKEQLKTRGKGKGIRIGVKTSGCSGMSYTLEFVDQELLTDQVFESYSVCIYSDPKDLVYLSGTVLEFFKKGLNEGLEFTNPNAATECGCGESFNI